MTATSIEHFSKMIIILKIDVSRKPRLSRSYCKARGKFEKLLSMKEN